MKSFLKTPQRIESGTCDAKLQSIGFRTHGSGETVHVGLKMESAQASPHPSPYGIAVSVQGMQLLQGCCICPNIGGRRGGLLTHNTIKPLKRFPERNIWFLNPFWELLGPVQTDGFIKLWRLVFSELGGPLWGETPSTKLVVSQGPML